MNGTRIKELEKRLGVESPRPAYTVDGDQGRSLSVELKERYEDFFVGYVTTLHKYGRLVSVDIKALETDEVQSKLRRLEECEDSNVRLYGALFEKLLREIKHNNELAESGTDSYHENDRIKSTFRILKLLAKVKHERSER